MHLVISARPDYILIFAEIILEGEQTRLINSSNNAFDHWYVQVPNDFVISLLFERMEMLSPWDGYTYLKIKDTTVNNSRQSDSCSSWTHLIDHQGQFKTIYKTFSSSSSSVQITFSSMATHYAIAIKIQPTKIEGKKPLFRL